MSYHFQNQMLERNRSKVFDYIMRLNDTLNWEVINAIAEEMDNNPQIAFQLVEDYFEDNDFKIQRVLDYLLAGSVIGCIVGMRGSGKTRLMYWLAEEMNKAGKIICFVNFQEDDLTELPDWLVYEIHERISDCPNNSFIFFDEYMTKNKEWNSDENKANTKEMAIARHKNKSVIYTSQSIAGFPIDIIRLSDIMFYKKFSLRQLEADRREFLAHIEHFIPQHITEVLFESNEFYSFFHNPLPSWEQKRGIRHG